MKSINKPSHCNNKFHFLCCALTHLKENDPLLEKVINSVGSIVIKEPNEDSFLFLVREIVGQMISLKVKQIIFKRLIDLCKGKITPESINSLSFESIKNVGLSMKKACYIKWLAEDVLNDKIDFLKIKGLSDDDAIKELRKIKGVGVWTAKMYLLFFLNRNDILPFEDKAFMQGFKWLYNEPIINERVNKKICSRWKPYSSIAARYLYIALDSGLTKTPVEKFIWGENKF